jgi:pimeloyl-ACP methyl ester carboxylesterase
MRPGKPRAGSRLMSSYTHETLPTQFVEANGFRYAYRRFGKAEAVPLLLLEYFNSNMDGWDPEMTNLLSTDHDLILFDNAGVGASGGTTPSTVEDSVRINPTRQLDEPEAEPCAALSAQIPRRLPSPEPPPAITPLPSANRWQI